MKHSPRTMLCALLVVAVYVLVAARAGLLAFVSALACALMVWLIARPH